MLLSVVLEAELLSSVCSTAKEMGLGPDSVRRGDFYLGERGEETRVNPVAFFFPLPFSFFLGKRRKRGNGVENRLNLKL